MAMDMDPPSGDEVDRDDPLLITTVRARLNREHKVKKAVGRKTVKRLASIKTNEDDDETNKAAPSVINPRRYQHEAFKASMSRNIILYLETGGGKTLVAVLLIKALAKNTRFPNDKRLIVFLAPTVILVQQQSRVVKIHTDLKVGEYYGARNVDNWGSAEWAAQIADVEVMVMTPQVLLNNLQHGFMKMDMIELLIFDECHHAYKNHAYAQIMKGFYHVNVENGRLPKIFGMTASPVTRKGVKTCSEAAGQLSGLEDMLKSEVFTLKDREEVEFVAPTASTIEEHYDAPDLKLIAPFKERIEALLNKYESANKDSLTKLRIGFKDQAELIDRLMDKINKLHRDLQFCLEELGLWCAYKAAEHSFKADIGVNDFEGFGDATQSFKRNKDLFLKESLQLLRSAVPEGWASVCTAQELQDAVRKGYLTPKAYQLVAILFQKRFTKDAKRIIFVERRMAAVVIASLVNQVQCLSEFLLAKWICGANAGVDTTRGQQQSAVAAFNQGEVNLLVATDIAEEGIDVQTCSEVIRFSLPKTLRSNIQSRGRARQQGSTYIVFLERGNAAQKEQFSRILRSEPVMREEIISREHMHANSSLVVRAPPEVYRVPSTGASVTPDTSVQLILRFCAKLPSDKFYMPRPEYVFQEVGSQHKCNLKLPPGSPIEETEGEPQSTPQLAKQLTALEACKQLHQVGALNDNLVPLVDFELDSEEEKFMKLKNASGVGTSVQKELYPFVEAEALTGHWHTTSNNSDTLLHAYCMSFEVQPMADEAHVNFVLLTGSALEDDVAQLETALCLTRGRKATAKLSPLGITTFSPDQLSDAKIFQTVLFNGMFSKMAKSAQSDSKKRKRGSDVSSLFIDRTDLWKPNNVYLLLPAVMVEDTSCHVGIPIPIDWKSIQSTSSAVKSLAQQEDQDLESCGSPRKKKHSLFKALFQVFTTHRQERSPEKNCLETGNCQQVSSSQLADAAVLTLHTMMIYPVLSVLDDTTALSRFPFPEEGTPELKSYADFFKMKYGLTLQYPSQPLLQLKQNHRAHNLLPTGAGKSGGGPGGQKERKPQKTEVTTAGHRNGAGNNVLKGNNRAVPNDVKSNSVKKVAEERAAPKASLEMPPELCLVLGFSAAVIRSAYWVPSVMHRIKTAVLASQLRRSINAPKIPVMEVLKALTTTRCNESFDMEALELFGDSFLKYAVSRKLFLELKTVNEGVLSTKRMHRICNRALHQLAVKRGLPAYIRDCQFDPSRWATPGMLISRSVTCHCKPNQLFNPFRSTTSKVIGVFATTTLTNQTRTETVKPRIGLTCDRGHRYLCSKTVADVMEALIGAYLQLGHNCEGALKFMVWAGIDVDYDPGLMAVASTESPVELGCDYGVDVTALERRIGYSFKNKYLPLEAMTHPSNMGGDRVRCYQRLEFLGDAVLDFLLTRHLFTSHPTSTPGLLTNLRSASVNNERFARVAVKHKLHCYLRHGSGLLLHQIEEFVKCAEATTTTGDDDQNNNNNNSSFGFHGLEAPKVLGDLVESIAGAILVDTCFDLDKVWAVMRPLLEPIVTPDTFDKHPVTELEELCSGEGYNLKCYDQNSKDGLVSTIRYEVHLTDELIIDGTSCRPKKKIAKKDAAAKVLAKLKTRGFKEKFGKPLIKYVEKLEIGEALANPPPIAEESQKLPEEKSELTSVAGTSDNSESGDDNQTHECREIQQEKETINAEQKPGPSEANLYPPRADISGDISSQSPLPSAKSSESSPCIPSTEDGKESATDEALQQHVQTVSIVAAAASKVGFIRGDDDAPEQRSDSTATTIKSSSFLLESSCTMVTTASGHAFHPKASPKVHVKKCETGNVKEGVVRVTRQGESDSFVELSVTATKIVQEKVREDVQKTKNVVPLPRKNVPLPRENLLGAKKNLSRDPGSAKRKLDPGDDHAKRSARLARFSWSQDVVVQNPGITLVPSTAEVHSKSCNSVKPTDEAIDLLKFCPWTGRLSSENIVQGRSSTTTKFIKSVVDVKQCQQAHGHVSSSLQPVRKPVSPKLSTIIPKSNGTESRISQAAKVALINSRQLLNEIHMKNKWSCPVFKLVSEDVPRFRFSLTVNTGKEKLECKGEAKADKRQAMESVASAMLTLLQQSGIIIAGPKNEPH